MPELVAPSLCIFLVEEEQRKEKDKALADDLLKCPEEGFHKDQNKEDGEDEDEENEDVSDPPEVKTEEQRWLETVISHCHHYVSMTGQPRWQMTAITIVTSCLRLLSSSPGQVILASDWSSQVTLASLWSGTWSETVRHPSPGVPDLGAAQALLQ